MKYSSRADIIGSITAAAYCLRALQGRLAGFLQHGKGMKVPDISSTGGGLATLVLLAAFPVQAADVDAALCRGPYPVPLMTPGECETHIAHLRALEARGDKAALTEALRQHALLLDERALACGCALMEAEPAQVAASSDC